jgi:hypothetical protein
MPPRIKSGPGQCPKCDKSYADLLEHITKKHRDDRFLQDEVDGTGLVLCICGRVVRNRVGLFKHQQRFGCLGTEDRATVVSQSQPLRSAPSVLPRPGSSSNDSSSLTSLPSTRPSSSLTSLSTLPAYSAVSSQLTSLSSAVSSTPASLLARHLDLSVNQDDQEPYIVDDQENGQILHNDELVSYHGILC